MRVVRRTTPRILGVSLRILGVSLIALTIFFIIRPFWFVMAVYSFISLPAAIPFGINDRPKLEQNFQEHRAELKAIVSIVRASGLKESTPGYPGLVSAKHGYWSLTGYKRREPQGAEYQQLYQAMRQARIQSVDIERDNPFAVQLVTDEVPAMIDINVYGYMYSESKQATTYYGVGNRLDTRWFLHQDRY